MSLTSAGLKRTFELALHMRKAKKIRIFQKILITFFYLIAAVKIIRLPNAKFLCVCESYNFDSSNEIKDVSKIF